MAGSLSTWVLENRSVKTAAGALFLCARTGRKLLNLRARHKSQKLTWALWGGMANANETVVECLKRELQEEMGTVPPIDKIYPFDIYESRDQQFRFYSFVCVVNQEFSPTINQEACGWGWFDLEVWPTPLHYDLKKAMANQRAQSLLEIIRSQHC